MHVHMRANWSWRGPFLKAIYDHSKLLTGYPGELLSLHNPVARAPCLTLRPIFTFNLKYHCGAAVAAPRASRAGLPLRGSGPDIRQRLATRALAGRYTLCSVPPVV